MSNHTIDPWGDHSRPKRKQDKFSEAREEGLQNLAANFNELEEAEKHVVRKDGGVCRMYGGLLATSIFQAITIVAILVGAIWLLSLLV